MGETLDEKLARLGDEAYERRNEPDPPGTVRGRGHGRAKVLQVRLNEDEYEALKALADEQTLPTSTLARHFLLKAMEPESSLEARVSRIEDELAAQRAKRTQGRPTRARRDSKSTTKKVASREVST